MKKNIQHPTSNIQHPVGLSARASIGCSMLVVGCWLFLFFALPVCAQTNDLPTLAPAYAELPPTFLEQHKAIVIIGVFAFLVLAVFVVWKILHPQPAPVLPPGKIARDALARLRAQPEDGKLLSEASQILRRYVSEVFNFPGGEMTTAEFCASISQNEKIGTELSGAVASFLHECDVRKFSPASAAPPINAMNHALKIIDEAEQSACQVSSPR
jgi:hypothetical protein